MSTPALDRKPRTSVAPRPDTSTEAIARRREMHRQSMADSALENCTPDPRAEPIHEAWIMGEITSDEVVVRLKEFLANRARL